MDVSQAVFDTLRFADRLKDSGFDGQQAEGLARALGDEFENVFAHVATKSHFDFEIGTLSAKFDALEYKVDALGARIDARVDALDYKVDALDSKLSARIDSLGARVDSLGTQLKFVFAMLALLLALGLVDTVPRLLG